jgi:superfamily II DNA or RNA helicase
MIELRPYQQRTIDTCRKHAADGYTRILVVAPTGAGKACIAAAIMHSALRNFGARSLLFVHRREVIDHVVRQLDRFGVIEVGVMRANDERTDPKQPIQIASTATLVRRDLPAADIVIVDECHWAPNTTLAILKAFPTATVFGLTATPVPAGGGTLGGDLFQIIACSATYKELIAAGWIAEPILWGIERQVDLSAVATTAGDFDMGGLEHAMDQPQVTGNIVETWLQRAEGRRTICFASGIKHSLSIVERFQQAGVRAGHLDGTTPEDERDRLFAALDSGELQVLSNVDVASEGWDQPSVKCMIGARPTLSLTKHMQQSGRILRPWNGVRPIILDHAGNIDRHGAPHLDRTWSLEAAPRLVEKNPYRMCPRCYAYVRERSTCELCGFTAPVEERPAVRENVAPILVEKKQEDVRRADFIALVQTASARGFKPGYASAKYKEKHGDWPPRSWGEEAKRMFATDTAWQFRQAKRENERAYWQGQKQQDSEPIAPEDAFGGWLKPGPGG